MTATFSERLVERVATTLDRTRANRRSVLVKSAVVGSAIAAAPLDYLLRPGTAYASVCGEGATCASGWTAFCCTVHGANTCPPGSFAAGWWKVDASPFCGGAARYIVDCNATCPTQCTCRCATGTCDERRVCCNQFRYGQCNTQIACYGPVVCRIALCTPPWVWDAACTTTSKTDNRTVTHNAPCLAPAPTPPLKEVFAFGNAPDLGSTAGQPLNFPLVGMASMPHGQGYWLVASDGGIFGYGTARFFGSTGGMRLNRPVVGMAATPSGNGYWLVASDGGIFAYGDARFLGSTGGTTLVSSIVGMDSSVSGNGYRLVAGDGGVFCYGDAPFLGRPDPAVLRSGRAVGIVNYPGGGGYWVAATR